MFFGAMMALWGMAGCAHSAECRKQIDACLRQCPEVPSSMRPGQVLGPNDHVIDSRTACERHCQSQC
jgi:hypothetical protein